VSACATIDGSTARGLPRTVRVEGSHDDGAEAERAVKALDALVGGDLARGVGRLPDERVRLGDRDGLRRAVHLAGGGVYEPRDALVEARLGDVERAHDVVRKHLRRGPIRVRDRDERREVKDHLAPARGLTDEERVAEVARRDLDRRARLPRELIDAPEVAARVVAHHGAHAVAARHEGLHEVAADETACARHENSSRHDRRREAIPENDRDAQTLLAEMDRRERFSSPWDP
jgi:hypothetical protein